jgi:hypothetical protein
LSVQGFISSKDPTDKIRPSDTATAVAIGIEGFIVTIFFATKTVTFLTSGEAGGSMNWVAQATPEIKPNMASTDSFNVNFIINPCF